MITIRTTITTVTLTVAIAAASLCFAQVNREKEAEIRKFFEVTGVTKAVQGMKGQMIEQFRITSPQAPKGFWDDFEKEIDVDELLTMMIPIYDKHLSLEDLKAANAFYATAAGKRLAEKTPIMTSEGFEVGRKWGEAKGRLAAQRLKEKGLEK